MNLIVEDKIYGKENIKENVLIDLINSPSLQRLKKISQYGLPDEYYHKKTFSRYEHSLGVFILLGKLGANLEERVSGLLHDVSHTAFSHAIDWTLGDPTKEDYQDKTLLKTIKNSEILEILKKHNFDYKRIADHENFSLLEKEIPSLCADRIDYSLREIGYEEGFEKARFFFNNLENKNGQIVFKDKEIAKDFAMKYMNLQKNHWAGNDARARYYLLSEILKSALIKKIVNKKDFKKTDGEVLEILKKSNDSFILKNLKKLQGKLKLIESPKGIELKKKFRFVDPEIAINGSFERLSNLSKEYFSFLFNEKRNSENYSKLLIK